MPFSSALLIKAASIVTAVTVIGTGLWKAGDYTGTRPVIKNEYLQLVQQVQDLQRFEQLQRFQFLQAKRQAQQGQLDFMEQQEMCTIARQLGFVGVPGC